MDSLDKLLNDVMNAMVLVPGVTEGRVMTLGPAPYRRLDCKDRALAYVRRRERKNAVRIDVSGLWLVERPSRIRAPTASGAVTLMVRTSEDVLEAIRYLRDVVAQDM